MFDDLHVAFGTRRWDAREMLDAGGGGWASVVDFVAVGEGSGIETRQEQWHVLRAEGGLIVRQDIFATADEALTALGVSAKGRVAT